MITTSRDGVELWWEAKGNGWPVLLIPGRGDSTDLYPRRFTDPLVAAGCLVIRYDPRDTGLSGDGGPTYTLSDMANDAVCTMDASGIAAVHVVGFSMGGLLLVDLAARQPERIASAVFISAMSPDPHAGMGEDFFAAIGADPFEATVAAMGNVTDDDREWVATEIAHAAERAPARPDSAQKHQEAAFRLGWPEPERLADISAPSLIIHGDADGMLPVRHAQALAAGIPASQLMVMAGMGHLPRPSEWDDIAERTARHVAASARA